MKHTKEITNTLSPDQLALIGKQRRRHQAKEAIRRMDWEIKQLQAKLTECSHPMTETYKWGDKLITHGKRCMICGCTDPYSNGRWFKDAL